MPATLYLVRHGETDDNVSGVPQGRRDVPLNAVGRAQTVAVATWFGERPLAAVAASPASRARAAAELVAEPRGLTVEVDQRLAEFDQGELDGLTPEEMRERYADFLVRWRGEDPTDLRMPGGETFGEVQARMVAACEELAARHPGAAVAVASHNLALKAALCHALGAPLSAFRRIRIDLASVTTVDIEPGEWWRVSTLNERCHVAELAENR